MNKSLIGFRGIHPFSALLFLIFVFTVSMASTHPLLLVTNFVAAFVCDFILQKNKALRLLRVLIPMLLLITAFNGVYNHYGVTVLFQMQNGNRFTLEALLYGLVFASKACTAIIWIDLIGEAFQSDKVIYLFGRISPRLALVISMALRFLPLIRRQAGEINAAQRGLGFDVSSNLFHKLRAAAHRLSILISWTLERGIDTSDSMRARGYGAGRRSYFNRFSFSPVDWLVSDASVCAFIFYLVSSNALTAVYNPVVSVPFPSVLGWLSYSVILFALFQPFIVEIAANKSVSVKTTVQQNVSRNESTES